MNHLRCAVRRRTLVLGAAAATFAPALALAQIRTREFKLGFQSPRGNTTAEGADKFAEAVARLSGGKLKVSVYPGGALGGDVQMLSALRAGTVDIGSLSAGLLVGLVKEFELLDLPYLFDNEEQAAAVVDGPFGQKLADMAQAKGIVSLGFGAGSFRNLTNSKRAVARLEDMKGLKIRVLQSPLALDLWKAFGTNAVPMPFPELYTALEQGAVDGQENPVALVLASKFYEVQKHLSLTRHVFLSAITVFSKQVWDALNEDERKVLRQASLEAQKFWREGARKDEASALAALRDKMTITEIAPAEMERLRTAARPVVDKHAAGSSAEMSKLLFAEIDRIRGKR